MSVDYEILTSLCMIAMQFKNGLKPKQGGKKEGIIHPKEENYHRSRKT